MTNILTAFIVFFSCFQAIGQQFAPASAEWYIGTKDYAGQPWKGSYHHFAVSADTSIAGKTVKSLQSSTTGASEYLYRENDSLFFYHKGAFYLAYDYSASVSDTMRTYWRADLEINSMIFLDTVAPIAVVVDSISTTSTFSLRTFHVAVLADSSGISPPVGTAKKYFENIGHSTGIIPEFFNFSAIPESNFPKLRCYTEGTKQFKGPDWIASWSCDTALRPVQINESLAFSHKFTLWPNPAQNRLQLSTGSDMAGKQIIIYNILGKVVCATKWADNSAKMEVDIQAIPNGHYILSVDGLKESLIIKR